MVAPHRSQAHSRCSLLHWAHRRLLHPQFAMVVLLRPTACSTPLLIGLTTACFAHCARPSCAPLAAPSLSPSLGLLRPVSATGGGLRAPPYQFPLKSYGFSGAETARKRFLLWKMKFSGAKIAPPLPYTPPGTIKARKGFGSTIRHGRPAAPDGLQYSLAHWASASPVSATGGGEAPPLSRSPLGFLTVCVQRALASRAIYIWNFTQLA